MLSITYKDNILNVNADTSDNNITVILTDSEFNAVPYSVNDANSFTISDPRFARYSDNSQII